MFKFCSLYSGSSGNCSLVQSDNANILIDCGESAKKIEQALTQVSVNMEDIDAILITHEHIDHVKSLGTLSKRYNKPIYINNETLLSLPEKVKQMNSENINLFTLKENFKIKDLEIHPFSIPHDAANPCGFNIFHNKKKMSIATDIGHITKEILENLEKSSFLLLESNYDLNVLKCSAYPYPLKQRISGPYGHLSNDIAGKTISHLITTGLETAMLGHLSKENNFPELAYKTVMEEIINNKLDGHINLSVATRYNPSAVINIS